MTFIYTILLFSYIVLFFFVKQKIYISLLVLGRGVVGWTVTVVDPLTDEEISVTTDDDEMTC